MNLMDIDVDLLLLQRDSLDRIEFDVHNPKNALKKPDVGTIFITERDNEISNCI
jgi:hypothetical protein